MPASLIKVPNSAKKDYSAWAATLSLFAGLALIFWACARFFLPAFRPKWVASPLWWGKGQAAKDFGHWQKRSWPKFDLPCHHDCGKNAGLESAKLAWSIFCLTLLTKICKKLSGMVWCKSRNFGRKFSKLKRSTKTLSL